MRQNFFKYLHLSNREGNRVFNSLCRAFNRNDLTETNIEMREEKKFVRCAETANIISERDIKIDNESKYKIDARSEAQNCYS